MRRIITSVLATCIVFCAVGQQDTVFVKYKKDFEPDFSYQTDTVIFPSRSGRNILIGTTLLPRAADVNYGYEYGIQLERVSKSDCRGDGDSPDDEQDRINAILSADSTLVIDLNLYANCCYDFLCDYSVDNEGTLHLVYYGYGVYCSCDCCFGLVYHFSKVFYNDERQEIKAVMLNGDRKTLKKLKE